MVQVFRDIMIIKAQILWIRKYPPHFKCHNVKILSVVLFGRSFGTIVSVTLPTDIHDKRYILYTSQDISNITPFIIL